MNGVITNSRLNGTIVTLAVLFALVDCSDQSEVLTHQANENNRKWMQLQLFDHCTSCHAPGLAFTDGYRRSSGVLGDPVRHNAPTLINVSYNRFFNWASLKTTSLERQHRGPFFGTGPPETHIAGHELEFLDSLQKDEKFMEAFHAEFPDAEALSYDLIIRAVAAYVRTLVSFNAPFDQWKAGATRAMADEALKGWRLFGNDGLGCISCHAPPLFGADTASAFPFYNVVRHSALGLVETDANLGLYHETGDSAHLGAYRVPTLRNLAFTAPYFHDGSATTLHDALSGIRTGKDIAVEGALSNEEYRALYAFLMSLNDSSILINPTFVRLADQ